MDFVAGIDVGAPKKGYHLTIKKINRAEIFSLNHFISKNDLIHYLKKCEHLLNGKCLVIAIDSPSKSLIQSSHTRSAENELVKKGYRVFWTPRDPKNRQQWMINGEKLWEALHFHFPDIHLIETFPTAVSDLLFDYPLQLNVGLFTNKQNRSYYKDFIDSIFAVITAEKYLDHNIQLLGEADTLNPIYLPRQNIKQYVLTLVTQKDQILLGYKKTGFGKDRYNGFGGKVEEQDLPGPGQKYKGKNQFENAAIRETEEEAGIKISQLRKAGLMYFSFDVEPHIMEVHVFQTSQFSGIPVETDEMTPQWFSFKEIPYSQMWTDDPFWLPYVLEGKSFHAYFAFKDHYDIKYHQLTIKN